MKTTLAVLVSAAVTLASAPAFARDREDNLRDDRPPSSGTGLLITGGVLTGLGAVNLLTSPLCKTSMIPRDTQDVCLGTSLVLGGAFAAVGLPLLFVGISRHNDYVEWKRQHRVMASLTDLGVAPTPGGAALTWHASF